jgi:hypothetical protein
MQKNYNICVQSVRVLGQTNRVLYVLYKDTLLYTETYQNRKKFYQANGREDGENVYILETNVLIMLDWPGYWSFVA